MTEALQLGAVDLLPTDAEATALGYMVEASADGTNWGNPEAVITAIQSRLQDGSLAIVDSFQNREAPIHIRCTAPSYQGLVNAEAALVAETRQFPRYNTLTWTPSVELAYPSVFDVVYGVLTFDFDDLGEVTLERHFVMTLTCLPFARSVTELIAVAPTPPPSTPVVTVVDTCAATTNWTGSPNAVSVVSGAVTESATLTAGASGPGSGDTTVSQLMSETRTAAISMTTTPYLYVDVKLTKTDTATGPAFVSSTLTSPPSDLSGGPITILLDGVVTPIMATLPPALTGTAYTRYYVKAPGSSVGVVTVQSTLTLVYHTHRGGGDPAPSTTGVIAIDQVVKTDASPAAGTRRQLSRILPVQGTMRTQGRLSVQHETSSLGEVIVYAYQDSTGYSPPLRPFYFAGGTVTPDTATVSGGTNMLDTLVEYRVPASLCPGGNYHLYARLKGDSAGPVTINIAAYTRVGSTDVTGTITTSATINLTTSYAIYDLAALSLPPTLLPDASTSLVRITLVDADTSGIDITLDEAWIFNLDIGTVNHVDCGSAAPAIGGSSKRLWFDPATVTNDGTDAIYRGHTNDRTDAFHPATDIKAWTPPIFEPPTVTVFTVTTNALDSAVELRHFPRFLHNVGLVA